MNRCVRYTVKGINKVAKQYIQSDSHFYKNENILIHIEKFREVYSKLNEMCITFLNGERL